MEEAVVEAVERERKATLNLKLVVRRVKRLLKVMHGAKMVGNGEADGLRRPERKHVANFCVEFVLIATIDFFQFNPCV